MMVYTVAAAGSVAAHTAVGQLAHMPVADATRVDLNLVVQTGFGYHRFHYGMGGGRTADVAETYEEKPLGLGGVNRCWCHSLYI